MFSFLQDLDNYESRKVGLDEAQSGIKVSTAYTSDEGYETAIIDSVGVHPVERYPDIKTAKEGHKKWLDFVKNSSIGVEFKELGGLCGLVGDKTVCLSVPQQ